MSAGMACTSAAVRGRRSTCRASSSWRAAAPATGEPGPLAPPVSWSQMSRIVRSPCDSRSSLCVAQPARSRARLASRARRPCGTRRARSTQNTYKGARRSVQVDRMASSGSVADLAALGVVVDLQGLFEVDGDLGAGRHVHRGEGLAVELVHPLRHLLHATGQNAAHGLVAGDAHGAQRAVAVAHHRNAAAVALDERSRARPGGRDERLRAQVLLRVAAPLPAHAGDAVRIADPAEAPKDRALSIGGSAVARVATVAAGAALALLVGDRADGAVAEHEGDRADLAAHARERPVAGGRAAHHGARYFRQIDAVGREVVGADEHLERVGVVHRAVDGHAADQSRHRHRPHERRIRGDREDRLGGLRLRAGLGFGCRYGAAAGSATIGRPEPHRKSFPLSRSPRRALAGVGTRIVGLHPADARGALGTEALAVAFLQAEADRQVGGAALAAELVELVLQFLQHALRLLLVTDRLLAFLQQAAALAVERGLDALVDGAVALAKSLILRALVLVVAHGRLQFAAQLLHLRDQRRHGVARRVAVDAERLHFLGCELGGASARGGLVRASGREVDAKKDQQRCHGNHQPLEQAVTFHGGLPKAAAVRPLERARARSSARSRAPAGSAPRRCG
ncbi:hypothetical protein XAC2852_470063 [Xanthomonas citri pv. citri]|nr:hypothetical protein XAC2852_470063 [Xanthomonas citri pv. citri]